MTNDLIISDNMSDEDGHMLFNSVCDGKDDGVYYKQLTVSDFSHTFVDENKRTVTAYINGKAVGFAAGTICGERKTAYISFVCVLREYRRQKIGTALLSALEKKLTKDGGIAKTDIVFHNPTQLAWNIPAGGDHPCAPGVNLSSAAYKLFCSSGYTEFCRQNSYYLKLSDYTPPERLYNTVSGLLRDGIEITLYEPSMYDGLYSLFNAINNEGWRSTVMRGAVSGLPVVVAVDRNNNNLICGYTGPLSISESGRGIFCGIGTHPSYRGRGIGTAVFCEMCRRHSENGAEFMSLYTGTNNPARKIYESAGFTIKAVWANMRKETRI